MDGKGLAHCVIVDQKRTPAVIEEASRQGVKVEAVCGIWWVPNLDNDDAPKCPDCEAKVAKMFKEAGIG